MVTIWIDNAHTLLPVFDDKTGLTNIIIKSVEIPRICVKKEKKERKRNGEDTTIIHSSPLSFFYSRLAATALSCEIKYFPYGGTVSSTRIPELNNETFQPSCPGWKILDGGVWMMEEKTWRQFNPKKLHNNSNRSWHSLVERLAFWVANG